MKKNIKIKMSLLIKMIFMFLIIIQLDMILTDNDQCNYISHCKKCPNLNSCEKCEEGYFLNSDNTKCLSSLENNANPNPSASRQSTQQSNKQFSSGSVKRSSSMTMGNNQPSKSSGQKSPSMANGLSPSGLANNSSLVANTSSAVGSNKNVPIMNNLNQNVNLVNKPPLVHPLASLTPVPSNNTNIYSKFPILLLIILLIIFIVLVIYYCSKRNWNKVGYFYDESGNHEEGTRVVYIR